MQRALSDLQAKAARGRATIELRAKAAQARRRSLPLQLPMPRRGVRFDRHGLERLIAAFGINDPVQIQWATDFRKAETSGTHTWTNDRRHVIKVRPNASAAAVNVVVLHEISHAAQSEEFGSPQAWRAAYAEAKQSGGSYLHNRYEREAREIEYEFGDDFRLAVAV